MSKRFEPTTSQLGEFNKGMYDRPPMRLAIAWEEIDTIIEPRLREMILRSGGWSADYRLKLARVYSRWARQLEVTGHLMAAMECAQGTMEAWENFGMEGTN